MPVGPPPLHLPFPHRTARPLSWASVMLLRPVAPASLAADPLLIWGFVTFHSGNCGAAGGGGGDGGALQGRKAGGGEHGVVWLGVAGEDR